VSLLHGFDISAYQTENAPDSLHGDYGLIKTSEGTSWKNDKFPAQWRRAAEAWKVRGGYHYAHPELSTPKVQVQAMGPKGFFGKGNLAMLDLEASDLSMKRTNRWAKDFGLYLRDWFEGVRTVSYLGSGYATNGTGEGLAEFFDDWMYPQYPSAYQIAVGPPGPTADELRAINRSSVDPRRRLLSAPKSTWPATLSPWLPDGLTVGKALPDLWQFTDHWPGGIDASVSNRTLAQLLGEDQKETEEEMTTGTAPEILNEVFTIPTEKGKARVLSLAFDSPEVLTYRLAAHYSSGHGSVLEKEKAVKVGGPASATDDWPRKMWWNMPDAKNIDWVSIELVAGDPTVPNENGKRVHPGFQISS
jgi:hypothetical protein